MSDEPSSYDTAKIHTNRSEGVLKFLNRFITKSVDLSFIDPTDKEEQPFNPRSLPQFFRINLRLNLFLFT